MSAARGGAGVLRKILASQTPVRSRYETTLEQVAREITERLQADARARFVGGVGAGQVRQVWRDAVRRLEAALRADSEG